MSALYPLWKKALMDASANSSIVDDPVNGPFCALTVAAYIYPATHQFYNAGSGGANASTNKATGSTNQQLTPTATTVGSNDGIFDGGDVTYTAVPSGTAVSQLIIYRHSSGADTTWRLISQYDTPGSGLPVTPNGGNITVTWNSAGIFQLSDATAKHEIEQIGTVGPLGLYKYRYRVSESPVFVGFIAQEVEKVMPWAVRTYGLKHINYGAVLHESGPTL